ncbi:hypothetical protein L2E82_31109 [Cichorium intybus]|uniref:Uncharacterized protein n=1 Tax=Cichorium intybus TaxID=13427 RepID=A0ACB9D245_CICIN|nr:hypothetical protein L2E82_31109 [Cichorium intybus]
MSTESSLSTEGTKTRSVKATFVATTKRWTEEFAKVSSAGFNKLVEMGFPEALVKKTLEAVGVDERKALD